MAPRPLADLNLAMLMAMLDCIHPPSSEYTSPLVMASPHSVLRSLLDLLMWLGSRSSTAPGDEANEELASLSAVLDCLIQSASAQDSPYYDEVWSPITRKAVNMGFLAFTQTPRFISCTLTPSSQGQQIPRKTFTLMEFIFLPNWPWVSCLRFNDYPQIILRVYLQDTHKFDENATIGNLGTSERICYSRECSMASRWLVAVMLSLRLW